MRLFVCAVRRLRTLHQNEVGADHGAARAAGQDQARRRADAVLARQPARRVARQARQDARGGQRVSDARTSRAFALGESGTCLRYSTSGSLQIRESLESEKRLPPRCRRECGHRGGWWRRCRERLCGAKWNGWRKQCYKRRGRRAPARALRAVAWPWQNIRSSATRKRRRSRSTTGLVVARASSPLLQADVEYGVGKVFIFLFFLTVTIALCAIYRVFYEDRFNYCLGVTGASLTPLADKQSTIES